MDQSQMQSHIDEDETVENDLLRSETAEKIHKQLNMLGNEMRRDRELKKGVFNVKLHSTINQEDTYQNLMNTYQAIAKTDAQKFSSFRPDLQRR